MRLVKEIPHSKFKIQVHQYNGKYILKIELGQFEQTYKIGELNVSGLDELENMISDEFLSNTFKRFLQMREDWGNSYKQKNLK